MSSQAGTIEQNKDQQNKLKVVISGVGHDQPGIVAAITRILLKHKANIEDSTMTLLAQEFAVILIVTLSEDSPLESLEQDLYKLETDMGMTFAIKPLEESAQAAAVEQEQSVPYLISVGGDDRTGITNQVAEVLAGLDVNITDLNARVIPGDDGPVYLMMVEITLPKGLDIEVVEQALRSANAAWKLEISVRSLEHVAL